MVARWIEWASALVDTWPDEVSDAAFDVVAAQESVTLAEQVDSILRH
jgi:hypothetical protein